MIFFAEYGAIAHFLLENHRVFTKEAGVLIPAWRSGRAAYSTHTCFMNELTDQLITLFSSALIAVMFIAVAVGIFRQAHAPNIQRPLKWHIPVDHLDMLDIAMCGIIVLYFSLGALMAAATPPGASAPPTTTNMELDGYKIFNGTCLNLILAFVLLVRMFHTGRMEALGLKKHSLKALLYAPVAGYLLVLVIHFLLDRAGLFQWIEQVTHAPAEQSIVRAAAFQRYSPGCGHLLQRRHRGPAGGGTHLPRLPVPNHEKVHGRLVCAGHHVPALRHHPRQPGALHSAGNLRGHAGAAVRIHGLHLDAHHRPLHF